MIRGPRCGGRKSSQRFRIILQPAVKWVLVILFPLNPASPPSFLFKKIELCCDISGDYFLFYSWFYMNFPLFHWNIARIPVEIMIFATTFLFWWRATLVKFGWEVAPQHFLFEWKSASEKFGREVAPPRFHFQSKSARSRHFTSFFGQKSDFRAIEGEEVVSPRSGLRPVFNRTKN